MFRLSSAMILTAMSLAIAAAPVRAIEQISTPVKLSAADVGTRISIYYQGYFKDEAIKGLQAQTIFTLSSVSKDNLTWLFEIQTIANTSIEELKGTTLTAFGFNALKSPIGDAKIENDLFSSAILGRDLPGYGAIDLCFSATVKDGECLGPVEKALGIGEATGKGSAFFVSLKEGDTLVLDNFFAAFKTIGGKEDGDGIGIVEKISVVNILDPLPEPGVWVQMIAGFGLIGAARRRQHRALAD